MIESNPGAGQGGVNVLARMYKNHLKNTRHLMKNTWGDCLVERLGLCTLFLEVDRIVQAYGFKLYLIDLLCWSCINLPLRTLTLPPKNYKTSFNLLQNCMHDWTIDFYKLEQLRWKQGQCEELEIGDVLTAHVVSLCELGAAFARAISAFQGLILTVIISITGSVDIRLAN